MNVKFSSDPLFSPHVKNGDGACPEEYPITPGMERVESIITAQLAAMKSQGQEHEKLTLQEGSQKLLRNFSTRLPPHVTPAIKIIEAGGISEFLVDYIKEAATNVHSFFQNVIVANISKLFVHLYDQLRYLFRYRKDIQKEMLSNIVTELKYQTIISPLEYTEIIETFDKGNVKALASRAQSIAQRLNVSAEDKVKLSSLIEHKNIIEGFRFLHLLTLLKTIFTHDDWEIVPTQKEKQELKNALTIFHQGGTLDSLHSLIYAIYSRIEVYEWLEKITSRRHSSALHGLKQALLENNPALFAERGDSFFTGILKEHATESYTLPQSQIEELHAFFKKSRGNGDSSFFATLALEIEQKHYFATWNNRAKRLHSLLKSANRERIDSSIVYNIARTEAMIENSMELWRLYEKVFSGDAKGHICNTYYSAQYGQYVATWRKINRQLVKLAAKVNRAKELPLKASHAHCNCDYADNKWHGLPEKNTKIRSLNVILDPIKTEKKVATLLGLYCSFGSGHRTALDAAISYSQQDIPENKYSYHARTLNVPLDVTLPLDPIHNTVGKVFDFVNSDWLYNFLLQKDRVDIIDWLRGQAGAASPEYKAQIKKLLREHILKENPDLLVATYSFHNEYIEEVAEELGYPLLHVATDFDLSGRTKAPTHPVFKMAIPAAHPKMMESLGVGKTIKEDQFTVTGPIVRPPFQPKSKEEIVKLRREMGIKDGEYVLVISSGGVGVPNSLPELLAEKWNDQETPLRVIVIPGRNSDYAQHINQTVAPSIKHPHCVQISAEENFIEDPSEMANYYHIANLVYGKPGGITTNEAAATGTQFLGDQSRYRASWEYFNNDIIIATDLGDKITPQDSSEQILAKIKKLIKKDKVYHGLFHDGTPPAQKFAGLMSELVDAGKNNETLQKHKQAWNPEETDLAAYIAGKNVHGHGGMGV